jgi:hypothetical protein
MNTINVNGKAITYQGLKFEDIIEWCKANNQVAWLKEEVHKTNAKGKAISFIEIKRNFAKAFAPEILPVAKPKKKTMIDLVDEL